MSAGGTPKLSVSLGLWQDRPAAEVVRTAEVADALGSGRGGYADRAGPVGLAP